MSTEITQLEAGLTQAKEMLALGDSLQRLKKNRDFKKVVMDTYFAQEPQRLTMLLAAPNVRTEMRSQINESLQAISEFHSFLNTILSEAERAKDLVDEYEDALVDANLGEDAGE